MTADTMSRREEAFFKRIGNFFGNAGRAISSIGQGLVEGVSNVGRDVVNIVGNVGIHIDGTVQNVGVGIAVLEEFVVREDRTYELDGREDSEENQSDERVIDPPKKGGILSGAADVLQGVISVAGLIPLVGNAADGLNAVISGARGNYGDATLDTLSAIPGGGQVVGVANIGVKFGRGGKTIWQSIKGVFRAPKTGGKPLTDQAADLVQQKCWEKPSYFAFPEPENGG